MFDELLTRVALGPSISQCPMSGGCPTIPCPCSSSVKAIVDEYNDEVMKCPTTPEEWRAISDNFAGGGTSPIRVVHLVASTSTASVLQTVFPYTITIKGSTPLS